MASRLLTRGILAASAIGVVAGLAGAAAGPSLWVPDPGFPLPPGIHLVHLLVFGAAASWLIFGGRGDRRAIHLGGVFLLTAYSFSMLLLKRALFERLPELEGAPAMAWIDLDLGAFLPYFLWLFAREFPRTSPFGRSASLADAMVRTSLAAGTVLLAGNFLLRRWPPPDRPAAVAALEPLARGQGGLFWLVVLLLALSAIGFIVWKAGRARRAERRRAGLFVGALALGMGPMFLEVLAEILVPPFGAFMSRPTSRIAGGIVLYPLLLSVPFTTAYAVLVHQVLDVKLVVRRALQYALARGMVVALTVLPFAGLLVYLFLHRARPLGELLTGTGAVLLALLTLAGLAAMRLRKRILDALDRRFFREQYDARTLLAGLVARSRQVSAPEELAELLRVEIDRALHLDAAAVLTHDPARGLFVAPRGDVRPLDAGSPLAALATGSSEPLDADLERTGSPLARLPDTDRQWLADGGFRLLLPLVASDGAPLGLVALGDKRSELPFTQEDRTLLTTLAVSASLALENLLIVASGGVSGAADRAAERGDAAAAGPEAVRFAAECVRCGRLQPPDEATTCAACGDATRPARVPYLLLDKFRFLRRLGAGGMGVVYLAEDLVLGRRVAVKTLPGVSPERALRMRREARAMAAVSHPHLALIFGAETWRGIPLLVFEFLDGGTLEERLAAGPLSPRQTIELGTALAEGVACLHGAGILHRDIKPSNIGFAAGSTPKLLDFGLARILSGDRDDAAPGAAAATADLTSEATLTMTAMTAAGRLVGTPVYMSPEAARGLSPEPSFDLWSLAVVLFESLTGVNPYRGETLAATLERIAAAGPPDARAYRADCPEELARFLTDALAPLKARKPRTARELGRRLARLESVAERAAA